MSKLSERINRKLDWIFYKNFVFDKERNRVNNIFDYQSVIKRRPSGYLENCGGNVIYGAGYAFRKYSGYKGRIYCATEHAISPLRDNNYSEYRDVDVPVVLCSQAHKRTLLQKNSDKLMFLYGPSFAPYVTGVYTDFSLENIKTANGKTIVVFPQHNHDASSFAGFMETTRQQIEYIKGLQRDYGYETVIACLYYVDIERGMNRIYEEQGWTVVSSGHNNNYDFGDCMKTIYQMADLVITQGLTGVAYATYYGVPCIYYKAMEDLVMPDGTVRPEDPWVVPIRRELEELFGDYHDTISDEQYEYACRRWGLDVVQKPDDLRLIFEFSKEIRKKYKNDKAVLALASKPKYAPIRSQIEEAVRVRREYYNA